MSGLRNFWSVLLFLLALAPATGGTAHAHGGQSDWQPRDRSYPGTIVIAVDARDVERGIFHVEQSVPVQRAGRLTLLFPKWVPGNHAPTARIDGLAGLAIRANGRALAWSRDPVDMHAFHVDVPAGVASIALTFDYLSPVTADQGRIVSTPAMLNLQWFSLAAYPAGYMARGIKMAPSVRLPVGWRFTTQLELAEQAGDVALFAPLSLEALLDAPIFAGAHFRRFALGQIGGAPAWLDVIADAPDYLNPAPGMVEAHTRLIEQAGRLFGAPPFASYRFMVALTDELGGIGTEHLASSENTRPPDYLRNWGGGALLPHELVHAWNGKARRPADLWSADFNQPMRNSLLFLYEGQTQFWGFVLAARSGMMTRDQVLDVFARLAASQAAQPGRTWRPLADTGNDAIINRDLLEPVWPSWQRKLADTYAEGDLMWLEADAIIRQQTRERASLDNFARSFFAGGGQRPSLYILADVIAALNRVAPYDWAGFLNERLHQIAPRAPSDWLAQSGYRLVYDAEPSAAFAEHQARANRLDLRHSIGLILAAGKRGVVQEVIWNSPAFAAGIVPGTIIDTVNGQPYSSARLTGAIQANRGGGQPIRLALASRNRPRIVALDYAQGLRYPRLERIAGSLDRLGALLAPR